MNRISVFIRRQRIKKLENWTITAILAEIFLAVIFPQIAAAAVIVGVITWFLRLQIDKKFKMRSLPFDLPVTIFVVLGTISVFMSPACSLDLIYNYCEVMGIFVLTYLLVGQNIRTTEQVKSLMNAITAAAIIVVSVGYFQYFFGVDISEMKITDLDTFGDMRTRVFSTLENPNVLAGYLDVIICLALGMLAKCGTRKQKIFLAAAIVFLVFCLAMTYSRGALLSIAIIFLIYGIFYDWRILILFATGAAILFSQDSILFERITSIFTANDAANNARIGIWVTTIAMIADHPFIGIGWGAYQLTYPQYNYYFDAAQTIYHAHNLYLQTAAEVGIAGALAYFWYFFGTMFMALALNSNERYNQMKNAAGEIAKRANESEFKKKFDAELVKTVAESKFLQSLAQIKSMFILRMAELIHQIFDKFSTPPKTETKTEKKSSPDVVHHEEMKFDAKNKKSDDKDDDDKFDAQKFADNVSLFESRKTKNDEKFIEGVRLGIGLAFLSMALNGMCDDLLFNIPSSILMWTLGALAASIEGIGNRD